MKDKEAVDILSKLLKDNKLSSEEKEAVSVAIGILGWSSLLESKMKPFKDKLDGDANSV
jgi:hypothetical protein